MAIPRRETNKLRNYKDTGRFISLSFTALTLCSFYSLAMQWVWNNQADQLRDVMPTLSKCLWFVTISSIIINSISLFKKVIDKF